MSGAKVIIVLGHENCAAIKSDVDVRLGNITALFTKIKRAVEEASKTYEVEKTSKIITFLEEVTKANINVTIRNIRQNISILKELEIRGQIKIV